MLPLANPTVGQGRLEGRVSGCKTDNQRSEPCRFALRRSGQGLIYSHRRRINFRWTEACPVDAPSSYLLSVDLQPAADAHVGINGFPTRSLRHDHQLSRGFKCFSVRAVVSAKESRDGRSTAWGVRRGRTRSGAHVGRSEAIPRSVRPKLLWPRSIIGAQFDGFGRPRRWSAARALRNRRCTGAWSMSI